MSNTLTRYPRLTMEEDCKFLSDRWGDAHRIDTLEDKFNFDYLVQYLNDSEMYFVAKRGDEYGLLFEFEYCTPGCKCDARDVERVWGPGFTTEKLYEHANSVCEYIEPRVPGAVCYFSHHEGNFYGRVVLLVFLSGILLSECGDPHDLVASIDPLINEHWEQSPYAKHRR